MMPVLLLLFAGELPARTVLISPSMLEKPIRVACPLGQVTRLVFPEAFLPGGVKTSPGATDAFGVALQTSRPRGIVTVQPSAHPAQGTLELRGQTVVMTIVLVTTAGGAGSEVRFMIGEPAPRPTPSPTAKPSSPAALHTNAPSPAMSPLAADTLSPRRDNAKPLPSDETATTLPTSPIAPPAAPGERPGAASAQPLPSSQPSAAPSVLGATARPAVTAADAFDLEALLLARPELIGRREGLPGQPPLTLDDALKSDRWVWLRFTLPGGAKARVEQLTWEHGRVDSFRAQAVKSDLRIVVQLPRGRVTRRTRLWLKISPGGEYKFSLSAPWLSAFVRELF